MSAAPKVVIITLPAYRAARTLVRTIAAIPEGVADELILVDDASRDETAEIAHSLGLRVQCTRRTADTAGIRGAAIGWRSTRAPTSSSCYIRTINTSRRRSRC